MKRLPFLFIYVLASAAALFAQSAAFRQEGIASWYGAEFAGRPTASGEIFDPRLMTAAHPSLPFGTYLRVTNLQNNRQAVVKVNDRGPFVAARIIDVSQIAAELLDIVSTGTAPVRIEALAGTSQVRTPVQPQTEAPAVQAQAAPQAQPATVQPVVQTVPQAQPAAVQPVVQAAPQAQPAAVQPIVQAAPQVQPAAPQPVVQAAPQVQPIAAQVQPQFIPVQTVQAETGAARIIPALPPSESVKLYRLQVGSYRLPRNAVDAFARLKSAGLEPAYEQYGEMYRVVLVGVRSNDVQSIASTLGRAGFSEALIREEH
ncbi:MAG: septal ring lytic transglycosylase RlpA family protein [Spirochaetaceae bacterium]|jgi:rare lipoprotein A|nr:septal ring lytic transglycosylase RlpA family protein [Spirochaetaceae bacterium]